MIVHRQTTLRKRLVIVMIRRRVVLGHSVQREQQLVEECVMLSLSGMAASSSNHNGNGNGNSVEATKQ
jgi:hypothetical protein